MPRGARSGRPGVAGFSRRALVKAGLAAGLVPALAARAAPRNPRPAAPAPTDVIVLGQASPASTRHCCSRSRGCA